MKARYFVTAALIVSALTVGCLGGGCGRISNAPTEEAVRPLNLPTVRVYDEKDLLEISVEDAGKFHGDACPCVVVAFRATSAAISRLWDVEVPKREDFRITSTHLSHGTQDTFDFITRAKTGKGRKGDFKVELLEGSDEKVMSAENYVFTFTRKSTGEGLVVRVKKDVFPRNFFELRKKAKAKGAKPEDKSTFKATKKVLKDAFVNLPDDKLFDFQTVKASAP